MTSSKNLSKIFSMVIIYKLSFEGMRNNNEKETHGVVEWTKLENGVKKFTLLPIEKLKDGKNDFALIEGQVYTVMYGTKKNPIPHSCILKFKGLKIFFRVLSKEP